ncbi:hypothetical protein [Peribacillus frigoritolerans]|uniref:hypothetical protein n=1 Tax=Peribacillus frigoritolerans TaxID=450367 RepID=UPI00382CB103
MELYIELFVFLAIIFLIVLTNRFIPWLVKAAIAVYYSVISYIFITTKNKIDERYENITPVPDAYWDKNSVFHTGIDHRGWILPDIQL